MIKSCYVHIPFCKKICSYCDFCKLIYHKKFIHSYLDSLEKEINSLYQGEVLDTLYIGGGTPTCLSYEELERLLKILSKLKLSKDVEYTIEGNVDSITIEKLELLKTYGINRLSIGIETTQAKLLSILERDFNKEQFDFVIQNARRIGFHNINFDLIYAIQGESLEDLDQDIQFLLSYDPEHISTYSLMIEEHTKLGIQNTPSIDEDMDAKMYEYLCKKLKENGYQHYEISNFSKKGFASRHNLCYWKNLEYYGFGLGASSYIQPYRMTNTRSITNYPNQNCYYEEEVSNNDKMDYEVLLGLRLLEGISLNEYQKKYGEDLIKQYGCESFIKDGLLEIHDGFLRIPEKHLYVSNEILVKLLQNKK